MPIVSVPLNAMCSNIMGDASTPRGIVDGANVGVSIERNHRRFVALPIIGKCRPLGSVNSVTFFFKVLETLGGEGGR